MIPWLGLRARVALVVVTAVLAAAVGITIAVYRLQANETTQRFTASARASTTSDANQISDWMPKMIGSHPVPKESATRLAGEYSTWFLQGRSGVWWCLLDFSGGPSTYRTNDGYSCGAENGDQRDVLTRVMDVPASTVEQARSHPHDSPDRYFAEPVSVADKATGSRYLAVAAPVYFNWNNSTLWLPSYVVVEFYDLGPLESELSRLQRDLLWITAAVVILSAGAALLATRVVQAPVRRLARAARRLGEGDLDVRVPVRGRDELAELGESFNAMAERVGDSIGQQRRFVADVAHDLRTPLAAMLAAAESVERGDPETGPRAARLLGDQTRRLSRLVEDLLEMSRFDAGVVELRPEPVDLEALWEHEIEPTAGVALSVAGDPVVTGDLGRLHTIARNLLTNAVRHGAEPITVTIDGTRPDEVVTRIADAGPGVPDDLLPLVFDRFTRGDRARGATEGSGLGLAIAQENATLHSGRIAAHNEGGAVFTLTLPRGHARGD